MRLPDTVIVPEQAQDFLNFHLRISPFFLGKFLQISYDRGRATVKVIVSSRLAAPMVPP